MGAEDLEEIVPSIAKACLERIKADPVFSSLSPEIILQGLVRAALVVSEHTDVELQVKFKWKRRAK